MNLTDLPLEIQFNIFSHLNARDFASVGATCHYFKDLCTDPHHPFSRTPSEVFQNFANNKFHRTETSHEVKLPSSYTLMLKDSKLYVQTINHQIELDERSTCDVYSKNIQIAETKVRLNYGTLAIGDKVYYDVLDIAYFNGHIFYSTLSGLYRVNISTLKSERVTKASYLKITIDATNFVIYGLTTQKIDHLDFSHPDARVHEEDTTLYLVKKRVIAIVTTFFKEFKNYVVEKFDWKALGIITGIGAIIGLGFTALIAESLIAALAVPVVFVILQLAFFALFGIFDTLRHAVGKALDVAFKPL